MKTGNVRSRLLRAFMLVIILPGILTTVFTYFFLRNNVVNRAQQQVDSNLKTADAIYNGEIDALRAGFELVTLNKNFEQLKRTLKLDYLVVIDTQSRDSTRSPFARYAFTGKGTGGMRVIDSAELRSMGGTFYRDASIPLVPTPRARITLADTLHRALVIEYAMPITDNLGEAKRVVYAGKIINRRYDLVDSILSVIYDNRSYDGRPMSTVTVFLDDVRIATNVLLADGTRAVGTRASDEVYRTVVKEGKRWTDRAFVVSDWRLTAYTPLRDFNGTVVGMLYVGILEKPFSDLLRTTLLTFLIIMGAGILLVILISVAQAGGISQPLVRLVGASSRIAAGGDLTQKVAIDNAPREINELAASFNEMATALHGRETSLKMANDDLAAINERYLDLVGMVSHELKGILSSTMLNACSVRDGYLGTLTPDQAWALASVVRNLEYFDETVNRFLDLSRIEKGELVLSPGNVLLCEDVIEKTVAAFERQAKERGMVLVNHAPRGITVRADRALLTMALNNLVGNAVKYGNAGGAITIRTLHDALQTSITVHNEGRPLTLGECDLIFKRFSRLDAPETRRTRGTGLGLFLAREIMQKHGGQARCESSKDGNSFILSLPTAVRND